MMSWEKKENGAAELAKKIAETNKTVAIPAHNRAWDIAKRTASENESLSETARRAELIRKTLEGQ